MAQMISRGTPTARYRAGIDGGMHPVFASKLPEGEAAIDKDVTDYAVASYLPAPGTIPSHATIPKAPDAPTFVSSTPSNGEPMVTVSTPATDTSTNSTSSGEGFLSRLSRSVGLRSAPPPSTTVAAAPSKSVKPVTQKPKSVAQAKATEPKPEPRVISLERSQQAQAKGVFPEPATAAPQSMAGAQPPVPSNSFDSRWSTAR